MVHPGGRPTKYSDEILDKAKDYLNEAIDSSEAVGEGRSVVVIHKVNLPTVEGLAVHLEISRETVYKWAEEKQEFSDIVEKLKALQATRLINNGLAGTYNPTIAKLILSGKHGYVERSDVTSGDKPLPILGGMSVPNNNSNSEDSQTPEKN